METRDAPCGAAAAGRTQALGVTHKAHGAAAGALHAIAAAAGAAAAAPCRLLTRMYSPFLVWMVAPVVMPGSWPGCRRTGCRVSWHRGVEVGELARGRRVTRGRAHVGAATTHRTPTAFPSSLSHVAPHCGSSEVVGLSASWQTPGRAEHTPANKRTCAAAPPHARLMRHCLIKRKQTAASAPAARSAAPHSG